jgi:hypothetical protein
MLNLGVNSAECSIELPHQIGERNRQRRPPPDQHIVKARPQTDGI